MMGTCISGRCLFCALQRSLDSLCLHKMVPHIPYFNPINSKLSHNPIPCELSITHILKLILPLFTGGLDMLLYERLIYMPPFFLMRFELLELICKWVPLRVVGLELIFGSRSIAYIGIQNTCSDMKFRIYEDYMPMRI